MPQISKVQWLAQEIVAKYVSYMFTDWDEAIHEILKEHRDQGTTYTKKEIAFAESIAKNVAAKMLEAWNKQFK